MNNKARLQPLITQVPDEEKFLNICCKPRTKKVRVPIEPGFQPPTFWFSRQMLHQRATENRPVIYVVEQVHTCADKFKSTKEGYLPVNSI